MSGWRALGYIVGISALVLSKFLVAQALEGLTLIVDLPENTVVYWYRKGPIFLIAALLILFGFDHILFSKGALMSGGREDNFRFVKLVGVVAVGLGIYWLYAALFGNARAW
jgi:hypothetical protein